MIIFSTMEVQSPIFPANHIRFRKSSTPKNSGVKKANCLTPIYNINKNTTRCIYYILAHLEHGHLHMLGDNALKAAIYTRLLL